MNMRAEPNGADGPFHPAIHSTPTNVQGWEKSPEGGAGALGMEPVPVRSKEKST